MGLRTFEECCGHLLVPFPDTIGRMEEEEEEEKVTQFSRLTGCMKT